MAAKRCSICAVNWPNSTEYDCCPICEEKTYWSTAETAMSFQQATDLVAERTTDARRHAEFDVQYTEYAVERFNRELGDYLDSLLC